MQLCERRIKHFAETAHLWLDDPFSDAHLASRPHGVLM
jgi:hypothetical protein